MYGLVDYDNDSDSDNETNSDDELYELRNEDAEPEDLFDNEIYVDAEDIDDTVTTLPTESNLDASEPSITERALEKVNDDDWNEVFDMEEQLLDSYGNSLDDVVEREDFLHPNFTFKVGQKFSTPQNFRIALKEWNVTHGYEVAYIKNENRRITAKCAKGCSWRIHASPMQDGQLFQVKSLHGKHVCGRQYLNKHCNSRYIAQKYMEKVRDNPTCSVKALVNDVRRELKVDCSYSQGCMAKRKAKEMIYGNDADQYKSLWDFSATLSKTNPGTTCKIKFQDTVLQTNSQGDLVNSDGHILVETPLKKFERFYVCFGASKKGFLSGCRPVIGLDGCFLKGSYRGQLLSAIGRDGNDNMYPIAIAVVEAERYDSWKWFLEHLLDDIGGLDENAQKRWVLISDRQKGLSNAIDEVFPGVEHRFCVRHMYENFKKKFKGKMLRDLFWKAAYAWNKAEFDETMKLIEKADPVQEGSEKQNAAAWLKKIPPKMWSRSHFSPDSKCSVVVNNLNESFNNYILPARELPIVDMVNWVRRKLMNRIQVKKKGMMKYEGAICPSITKQLEKNKERSRNCFATYAGDGKFEVQSGQHEYVVNLRSRTCTCGMFGLSGIPCPHAIGAIQIDKGKVESYVDEFFKKDMYISAYSFMIHPVPSMLFWEKTGKHEIMPPDLRKQPGRPKKLRKKDPDELKKNQQSTRKNLTVTCAICNTLGHNSRTCKNRNTTSHAGGSDTQPQPLHDSHSMSNASSISSQTARHAGGSDNQPHPLRDSHSMSNSSSTLVQTTRHAAGSESQRQPLREFPSMSNASSILVQDEQRHARHQQNDKQTPRVTPKRTNGEGAPKGQHDFPPRRSPRLQGARAVQKLPVISKAKGKQLGDSTTTAPANFVTRRSPRGFTFQSTSQVPLKPQKPRVAVNLAQKFDISKPNEVRGITK